MAVKIKIAEEHPANTVVLKLYKEDDGEVSVVSLDNDGEIDNFIVRFVNDEGKISLSFAGLIQDSEHFNLDEDGEIELA